MTTAWDVEDAAAEVAQFITRNDSVATAAVIAVTAITEMAEAYTRGGGFDTMGNPRRDVQQVIMLAAARLASNPGQLPHSETVGAFASDVRGAFQGWTLAELAVLNRYRRRAM